MFDQVLDLVALVCVLGAAGFSVAAGIGLLMMVGERDRIELAD